MNTTVTYIWGPMASGKTSLARKMAGERSKSSMAIVDLDERESIQDVIDRNPVEYLYICAFVPPTGRGRIRVNCEIRLRERSAA